MTRLEHLERVIREHGPFRERDLIELNLRIALEYAHGFMTRASEAIGLSQDAVHKRLMTQPHLKELRDQIRQNHKAKVRR